MDTITSPRLMEIDAKRLTEGSMQTGAIRNMKNAFCTVLGPRETNEDAHTICDLDTMFASPRPGHYALYGVFDGHGGDEASKFVSGSLPAMLAKNKHLEVNPKKALELAFQYTDRAFAREHFRNSTAGSTVIVLLVVENDEGNTLYVANAGDCRAIVGTKNGETKPMSTDHNPLDPKEYKRITDAGGRVIVESYTHPTRGEVSTGRVDGILSVARGIGDLGLKPYVSSIPDVRSTPTDDLEWALVACDGLWDVFSIEEAAEAVRLGLSTGTPPEMIVKGLCDEAVMLRDSTDNVTAMLVQF